MRRPTLEGKILVAEGGDGSGKGTQVELLASRLSAIHYDVRVWDFPGYKESVAGWVCGRMLSGKCGEFMTIDPWLAAMPLAMDRVRVRDEMRAWLAGGGVVICNRFVGSNLAHGAAKFTDFEEAKSYMEMIARMEFGENGLPVPDVSFYLATDAELSQKLVLKKRGREYLDGAVMTDQAERDLVHQTRTREMYEYLCETVPWFCRVECMRAPGELATIEEIHEKLWLQLKARFIV